MESYLCVLEGIAVEGQYKQASLVHVTWGKNKKTLSLDYIISSPPYLEQCLNACLAVIEMGINGRRSIVGHACGGITLGSLQVCTVHAVHMNKPWGLGFSSRTQE